MIEELRRFILVAQEGNISRTAEKLYLTQSALTQSVQRLEKNVGTKLLTQKGKQLQLTADGEALVTIGEKILQLWQNAKDPAIRTSGVTTYSLGMFDNAAVKLRQFINDNLNSPTYRLEITIASSGQLMRQLQLGVLDAAVCVLPPSSPIHSAISLVQTFSEDLIPVSAKRFSHPIDEIPFILYNQGSNTRAQIDNVFRENNIIPKIYAESTSTTFMKELALLGSGVALLPENVVKQELTQRILKKQNLHFHCERFYGLLFNSQSISSNNVILEQLTTILSKKQA